MSADPHDSSPMPLAEISQGPSAFELFLDRNQKNLVILTIILVLAAAVLVVYNGIEKSKQETAGAALNNAEDLKSLQSLIVEHSKTNAAQSAMVLLADRQWTEGQQDNAIQTLKKFIAETPNHPAIPTAMASLGAKFMTQGKTAEATKIFQDIVSEPKARFIAPYALISLGDISKIGGDLENAEASYDRVKKEFPESSFAQAAILRSATLKTKAPVEIAPPPPPAKEPSLEAPLSPETPAVVTPVPTPP